MEQSSALTVFLALVLYPLWLGAGAVDYVCHRRTLIAATSGTTESNYHVAQLCCAAVIVVGAALFEPSVPLTAVLTVAVVLHTVLAYLDVRYTQPKRYVSPLEQQAHSFMEVLPIIAVMLLAVLGLEATGAALNMREMGWPTGLVVASFILFAGMPVFEERWRIARASRGHVPTIAAARSS